MFALNARTWAGISRRGFQTRPVLNPLRGVNEHYRKSDSSLNRKLPDEAIDAIALQFARSGSLTPLWKLLLDQLECAVPRVLPDVAKAIVGHLYLKPSVLSQDTIVAILRACLNNPVREGWAWYRALRTISKKTLLASLGPSMLPSLISVARLSPTPREAALRARQVFEDEVLPTNVVLPEESFTLLAQLMLELPRQQQSELIFPYIQRNNLTPSVEICEALVAQFCIAEEFELVPEGLRLLFQQGRPSVEFYNRTLELYVRHQHAAVGMILEHMKASEVAPDLDTLAILLPAGLANFNEFLVQGENSLVVDPRRDKVTQFCSDLGVKMVKEGQFEDLLRLLDALEGYNAEVETVYLACIRAICGLREAADIATEIMGRVRGGTLETALFENEQFTLATTEMLAWAREHGHVLKVLEELQNRKNFIAYTTVAYRVSEVYCMSNQRDRIPDMFNIIKKTTTWPETQNVRKKFRFELLKGVNLEDPTDWVLLSGKFEIMSLLVMPPLLPLMLPFLNVLIASFAERYRGRYNVSLWERLTRTYSRYLSICNYAIKIDSDTISAFYDCVVLELVQAEPCPAMDIRTFQEREAEVDRLRSIAEAACKWLLGKKPAHLPPVVKGQQQQLVDLFERINSSNFTRVTPAIWLRTLWVLAASRRFLSFESFNRYREVAVEYALVNYVQEGMGDLVALFTYPDTLDAGWNYCKEDFVTAQKLFATLRARSVVFPQEELVLGVLFGLRNMHSQVWTAEASKEIFDLAKGWITDLQKLEPPVAVSSAILAVLVQLAGRDTLPIGQVFAMGQQLRVQVELPLCVALMQGAAQPSDLTTILRYIDGYDPSEEELQEQEQQEREQQQQQKQSNTTGGGGGEGGGEAQTTEETPTTAVAVADAEADLPPPTLTSRLEATGDAERLVEYFRALEPFKIEDNREPRSNDKRFSFRNVWASHLKGTLANT